MVDDKETEKTQRPPELDKEEERLSEPPMFSIQDSREQLLSKGVDSEEVELDEKDLMWNKIKESVF